jgi:hypothetical protein
MILLGTIAYLLQRFVCYITNYIISKALSDYKIHRVCLNKQNDKAKYLHYSTKRENGTPT